MARRSKSSDRWLREHFTGPFVKRAKAEGWRSRAIYKLEEMDRGAPRSMYLAELALEMAQTLLKPDGSALIELLQGAGFQEFVASARRQFRQIRLPKPEASRGRSPETYLLASGRRMV